MVKTFVIHDESLNSYGFWMMTAGADLSQFQKNPIMLWNHNRGGWREDKDQVLPIGHWENIRIEGTQILADAVFDNDEFAAVIAAKVESGTLRMASIGAKVIEESEDPQYIKPGQRYGTVLKFKVREASVVDIGSNDNALALYDDNDALIELSANGGVVPLKELNVESQNNTEMKEVAKILNLKDNATEAEFLGAIKPIMSENTTLRADLEKERADKKELQDKLSAIKLAEKTKRETKFKGELTVAFKDGRLSENEGKTVEASMMKLFEADPENAITMLRNLPKHTPASETQLGDQGSAPQQNSAWAKRQQEIKDKAASKKGTKC